MGIFSRWLQNGNVHSVRKEVGLLKFKKKISDSYCHRIVLTCSVISAA